MGMNLKQRIKRAAAWALAFTIAVPFVSFGAAAAAQESARETGWYAPKEHAGVDFSQMEYRRYELADMEAAAEKLVQAAGTENGDQQVLEAYRELLEEVDRMGTMYSLADIAYSRDMDDQDAADETEYMRTLYPQGTDRAAAAMKEALDTSYGPLLEEQMGKRNARSLRYYEEMDPVLQELGEREQQLVLEYDQASSAEYQVKADGEDWTYERLAQDLEPYSGRYYEIQNALDRERNKTVGEIYRQLVQVRREIAEECGYDNYADYAYQSVYGRDFTKEDVERIRADVKEIIVPLIVDCWYSGVDYEALYELEPSDADEILDLMEPYVGQMSGELGEAFSYMRRHGLYDMERAKEGENRSGGFTTDLPYYGDGFIFLTLEGDYDDYLGVFHEFGHFASIFGDPAPSMFRYGYVDVSEIDSQGLQMLLMHYADEMFGDVGRAVEMEAVSDLLDSIITGAMMDEFETAVYADPDMPLDEMNRLFASIAEDYGGLYFDYDGENCYGWDMVPHIYHSPLYYISYGTSAFPALRLWIESDTDWEGTLDRYMMLSATGSSEPYRKTLRECEIGDIFQADALPDLDREIRERLDLPGAETKREAEKGETGIGAALDGNELKPVVMLFLGVAGAIAVLQLMVLCTGFVIIWLLVKDRKQ